MNKQDRSSYIDSYPKLKSLLADGWMVVVCVWHDGGYPQKAKVIKPGQVSKTVWSNAAYKSQKL